MDGGSGVAGVAWVVWGLIFRRIAPTEGMHIRLAEPSDSDALCELMERCPMGENLRLTFERRPDYFLGAGVQAENPLVLLGEGEPGIFGVFAAGSRRVFVDGQPRNVRYLSDLRIDPRFRRQTWLARGYRYLRGRVFEPGEFAQTLILSDNAAVMKILTSRRAGLPGYFPHGTYLTHFLRCEGKSPENAAVVSTAESSDLAEMQDFFDREAPRRQFYPCYRLADLESSPYHRGQRICDFVLARSRAGGVGGAGELAGMLGIWDQSGFRQTRIHEYRGALRFLRPLANFASPVPLPPAGETLPIRYVHSVLVRGDDPAILREMLAFAMKRAGENGFRGAFALGLDAADPLNAAIAGFRKRTVAGRHFLVSFEEKVAPVAPGPFYFESARI